MALSVFLVVLVVLHHCQAVLVQLEPASIGHWCNLLLAHGHSRMLRSRQKVGETQQDELSTIECQLGAVLVGILKCLTGSYTPCPPYGFDAPYGLAEP